MASIFLSYDRDDEPKARPVAALLERNGHKVWWDRQIKGGHEFGAEIEAALNEAEKVVVLWSQDSVKSAWVRDEAAVGRDSGRLVPTTIDGTAPPLGFRQFQTIDLSRWKGRASSPEVEAFLSAVETGEGPPREIVHAVPKRASWKPSRALVLSASGAIAIAAAGIVAWQFWPSSAAATPTFAIIPADGSSSSAQFASDMLTRLEGFADPSATSFHLADAGSRPKGGYALKVAPGSPTVSGALTLVSGGATLWSAPLERGQQTADDFAQTASMTAQRALSCAADALTYRREKIDRATVKLYVTGCTRVDDDFDTNVDHPADAKLFRDVIAKAPHFAAAWSKLFALDADNFGNSNAPRAPFQADLGRARRLGIEVGEAYALQAALLPPSDFSGIFQMLNQGIDKFPDNAFLYRWRGQFDPRIGRMEDAVADNARSMQLDPLSAASAGEFAAALAYAGHTPQALDQLNKAQRMWPNSVALEASRGRIFLRFGDPIEAQRIYLKRTDVSSQNPAQWAFIQARIDPTPRKIEAALDAERTANRQYPIYYAALVQALAYFGQKDEAIDVLIHYPGGELFGASSDVLFRPYMRDTWRDPRSMAAAAHTGLLHYWKSSGQWPDFCFDPTLPYDCKKEAAKYRV